LARTRPALAFARPQHAAVPAVPRRHSVRGRLLGQAVRVLGRGRAWAVLAGARRRHPYCRGPLLLLARGQADVHRGARATRTRDPAVRAGPGRLALRRRRGRPRRLSEAGGDGSPARRRSALLTSEGASPPSEPPPRIARAKPALEAWNRSLCE